MDNGKKNASKVLTTNDIREGARNWTLAGDVGLLAHLEQFSENIFSKTQETQKHFTDLVDDYEELYTKVGNVTNQFLALQNCQFVENRVYDEETPTEEKTEVKVKNEVEQEKLLLMQYKEAVEVGIKLLDTHFQEVQLPPNSDSDDDDDGDGDEVSAGNSVIWKPKNPYAGKKFPLLIGSAEWWADDYVGLGAEEDMLDTEKIISESDSDMESLKSVDKGMKSSSSSVEQIKGAPTKPTFLESSSEDLFGLEKNENVRVSASDDLFFQKDSLLDQPDSFLPDFDKEPETETTKGRDTTGDVQPPVDESQESPSGKQPNKVENAFTRELMAKLSSVTNRKDGGVTEEKKKGGEDRLPPAAVPPEDNLFDETDDSSDLFSAKLERSAEIGVEKKGLFFDGENDDELFKGERDLFSGSNFLDSNGLEKAGSQPLGGGILETSKEPEKPRKEEPAPAKKSAVKDLFDDLDDDDILFGAAKPEGIKSGFKSLPSEEEPGSKKSKSAGPVWDDGGGLFNSIDAGTEDDFFSSSGLFATNANKPPTESSSKKPHLDLFPEETQEERKVDDHFEDPNKKSTSIFDSPVAKPTANPFGFSPTAEPTAKKTTILDSEDDDDDDLFSKGAKEKKPPLKAPAFPDDEDTSLFADKPKPSDSVSVSSSRSSLFDDMSASKSRLASVFEKDKSANKPEDDLFSLPEDCLFGEDAKPGKDLFSTKVREKEKTSLFDDCDDGDDLFGVGKAENTLGDVKKQHEPKLDDDDDLFKTTPALRETKSEILRQPESKLFADDLDDAELFSTKPPAPKPKPPDSLSLKATESDTKTKMVGKLNIPDNLKVRFESAAKHIAAGPVRPPPEVKDEVKKDDVLNDVLDDAPRASNLLKCPSKDRVKIPARRRPQSRRARQEAIRNSGVWDQPSSPGNSANAPHPSRDSLPSPVASNPLSPSTDEEDFFKVPELDTNFEKEDQSIFKSDLFESSKSSKPDTENLLFDGAPVLSPLSSRKAEEPEKKSASESEKPKPKPASLFDDDDDVDDTNGDDGDSLFKSTRPLGGQLGGKKEQKGKKSLFDEDSDGDEDDLFGGKWAGAGAKAAPVGKVKEEKEEKKEKKEEKEKKGEKEKKEEKEKKGEKEKKEEKEKKGESGEKGKEISSFVDPLGLMSKD